MYVTRQKKALLPYSNFSLKTRINYRPFPHNTKFLYLTKINILTLHNIKLPVNETE